MRWWVVAMVLLLGVPGAAVGVEDGPGDAVPGETAGDEDAEGAQEADAEDRDAQGNDAGGAEDAADEAADGSADGEAVEEPAPVEDPFEAGLRALVTRYYRQIGSSASDRDLTEGIQSIKLMLMDGVSLDRIEAAVNDAITLHTPGRRVPFPVAVPLRVKPAGTPPATRPQPPATSDVTPPPSSTSSASTSSASSAERAGTVIEERWVKRQEELRARRNRLRLYLQWRDRTRDKRILLSVGIPMFAAGWAGTWALAGGALTTGSTPPSIGWTGAIPVVGPFIFGAATAPDFPPAFVFGGFQGIGLVLTIVGLAQKHDLPYDRDPTAMRIGRDPKTGRAIMTISPGPMGLTGRF